VALILPLTQQDGPSTVGRSLRHAAELAVIESGENAVTVLLKDDQSTPEGARQAAEAALAEGAEVFIGPLFSSSVREVGRRHAEGGAEPRQRGDGRRALAGLPARHHRHGVADARRDLCEPPSARAACAAE
jgi:hypothetical protein